MIPETAKTHGSPLRRALPILAALALLAPPRGARAGLPADFSFTTVATGFVQPMSFAYAPDGRIFVAERGGVVKVVQGGATSVFLDMRDRVNAAWGRGIVSIAVDPGFATNKRLYLLYHEELNPANPDQNGSARWRLARLTPRTDNPDLADMASVFTLATDLETDGPKPDPHSGGDIDFDLDGNLLASFGDGATPTTVDPQATRVYDMTRLHGKIIRVNTTTGNGIPGNPYYEAGNPGSIRSKVLARGLRQPFRITVDRQTGAIYEGDVGWDAWEELNIIHAGPFPNPLADANYGWPCFEGAAQNAQYRNDGRTSGTCNTVYAEGARGPAYAYAHNGRGASIIVGKAYRGATYPGGYLGKVFWADYDRDEIWMYTPGGGVARFGTTGGFGSMVNFEQAPNGNLAYLSYNEGRIREITYLGANRAPVANGTVTYVAGTSWRYTFTGNGSSDPDGDPLTFSWTFGDGTAGSGNPVDKVFAFGSYDITLTVTDSRGASATKAFRVDAGNRPPTVSFTSPANNSTFAVGDVVNFQIEARDAEDGVLPASRVAYQVLLHHNDHSHPEQPVNGLSGSFTATFPELVETHYEIRATARDDNGGLTTANVFVRGRLIDVTFASTPSGIGITVDGAARTTPYTARFIQNSVHSVIANASHTANGVTSTFLNWSNNGAVTADRELSFTVPAAARTLSAAYGIAPFPRVHLRGTHNGWAAGFLMTHEGGNRWSRTVAFPGAVGDRFKFDIDGDWTRSYGDAAPADGIADPGSADIAITQGAGDYLIQLDGNTLAYSVVKQGAAAWKRTVIFMHGVTQTGQDMFLRGGIDHAYANANLGRNCAATNFECAMPIRHLNLRNTTTAPWKANDTFLDWYGTQAGQSAAAPGTPADWTTDAWPADWGARKTVAADGYGEEPLNTWGRHYWMLDAEMDCSKSVNGWFEVKSFISGGPGWEPNLSQPGVPYASGNHFAKCGEVNMFRRGSAAWEHYPLP